MPSESPRVPVGTIPPGGGGGVPPIVSTLPEAAITTGVASGNKANHVGVYGSSEANYGVYAESKAAAGQYAGLYATGTPAAHFQGDVEITGKLTLGGALVGLKEIQGDLTVTGDIRFTSAADCAEDFTIGADLGVDPGTVVVLGAGGALFPSQTAYDKRVVGVVSGAGECKPGIILDRQQTADNRQPVALVGKVYCKVDAGHGPVDVGDLLTTSPTPGHAMRATDPLRAFGAVIGKALEPLKDGQSLIPVLVALQ
jgi:hypothetical protein